ncbi:MAG: type II secretion system protein [Patescibacteria group bacterium]|nr:type II secretion system protein [Patescibacteria group bacterium]
MSRAHAYKERSKGFRTKGGFTLIEIVVSLAIFAIVAMVALSALVKIMDANKKAQTIQDAVTSLSYALDSMSRELRTGSVYYCQPLTTVSLSSLASGASGNISSSCQSGLDPSSNGAVIAFLSPATATRSDGTKCRLVYAYLLAPIVSGGATTWELEKAEQQPNQQCTDTVFYNSPTDTNFAPIVDPSSVTIDGYYVKVALPSGSKYPLATVGLKGYAGGSEQTKTYFSVQTAASPRIP